MVTYPEDWKSCPLLELTSGIVTGGTPSTGNPAYWNGSIPWLASTEIHQKRVTRPTTYITDTGLRNSSAKVAPANSILIALAGQGKTRGTAAILEADMAINQSLAALIADNQTHAEFLFYKMESQYEQLREISSGDGGRGGLNKKLLKAFPVCLPSLYEEQRAIAEALTSMDTHISNLTELIEKKKAIRDGALEDLVSGHTRLEGFHADWVRKSLLSCVELVQGLTYSPDNVRSHGTLVLRSSNIQDKKLVLDDNVYVEMSIPESKLIQDGDILICVRNGSSALIGKSCVLHRMPQTTFGAFMSVLRGDKTGFIAKAFNAEYIQAQLRNRTNATINQITKKDFEAIMVWIPSTEEEQKAIVAIISSMDDEIASLEAERDKMRQIKAGMMDNLLTGRMRLIG